MIRTTRRLVRLTRLAIHLIQGVAITALWLPHRTPAQRMDTVQRWSGGLLRALAVDLRVTGPVPDPLRPAFLVSNHISWLDVFVIDAVRAARFIAKSEVRGWPILGWLSAQTGTLFIERERRHHTAAINVQMGDALKHGDPVALFAEGTTSVGDQVRHFHSALFQAAVQNTAPVVPVALRYPGPDGGLSRAVPYVDDDTFMQSMWRIAGEPRVPVEVMFGEGFEATGMVRREVSQRTRAEITRLLCLPTPHTPPGTAHDPPA